MLRRDLTTRSVEDLVRLERLERLGLEDEAGQGRD